MTKVLEFLRLQRYWPIWVTLAGALVLLPWLGKPGFWEPHEIKVADQARTWLEDYSLAEINGATAAHYRVQPDAMKGEPKTDVIRNARNVAVYLALRHTRETRADLLRSFALADEAALSQIDQEVASALASPEAEPAAGLAAISIRLETDRAKRGTTRPPFTEWAVSKGLDRVGMNETGARLPLALLGLIALLATYFIGRRIAGPRAGLLASLVMLTFPLFVLQSRQLMSDIGAVAGSALLVLGLIGLSWPHERRLWAYPIDAALVAVGAVMTYYAAGALLGLAPPIAAVALGNGIALGADRTKEDRDADSTVTAAARTWRFIHLIVVCVVATIATVVVLGWVFGSVFDMNDPIPGDRAVFGKSFVAAKEYVASLGGVWRENGNLNLTFENLFEQIAFGLFPWSALAPLAIAHIAMGPRRGRRSWGGYIILAWAAFAWACATVMTRKVGAVHFPAVAAAAVAVGMWLDDLLSTRSYAQTHPEAADANADPFATARKKFGMAPNLPLAALFVGAAVIVIGKDLHSFPENLTSLTTLGAKIAYPKGLWLVSGILAIALAFSAVALVGLAWWRRERPDNPILAFQWFASRHAVTALVAIGLLFSLFMAQAWLPTMSRKLSSKELFAAYQDLKSGDDRLGVMGEHGSGPKYYAGDSYAKLNNRGELLTFLRDTKRVFALVPAGELCPVHRAAGDGGVEYHVLDNSNAAFLLMSNRIKSGERDLNPLAEAIVREPPANIGQPVSANYDDKVELLGVDMPARVERGESFKMTLYYKVLAPVGGNWKIFVHFDTGGMRFQGDHDPIRGRCGTSFWQPGDYIIDTFWVNAGDSSYPKTNYVARVGLFQGSHGNWRNMKVKEGNADENDRVFIGNIQVR